MKANETQSSNPTGANVKLSSARKHESGQYQKVFDARKRRLRGLWERNGAFYGQLSITNPRQASRTPAASGWKIRTAIQSPRSAGRCRSEQNEGPARGRQLEARPQAHAYPVRIRQPILHRLGTVGGRSWQAKAPDTIRREKATCAQ